MFSPGDVLQLKSGGPHMTAMWSNETETCCTWFPTDQSQEPVTRTFLSVVLEKVE